MTRLAQAHGTTTNRSSSATSKVKVALVRWKERMEELASTVATLNQKCCCLGRLFKHLSWPLATERRCSRNRWCRCRWLLEWCTHLLHFHNNLSYNVTPCRFVPLYSTWCSSLNLINKPGLLNFLIVYMMSCMLFFSCSSYSCFPVRHLLASLLQETVLHFFWRTRIGLCCILSWFPTDHLQACSLLKTLPQSHDFNHFCETLQEFSEIIAGKSRFCWHLE